MQHSLSDAKIYTEADGINNIILSPFGLFAVDIESENYYGLYKGLISQKYDIAVSIDFQWCISLIVNFLVLFR